MYTLDHKYACQIIKWIHSHGIIIRLCLKITRCVEAIKKIRERELHYLEAMVGVPFTLGPLATPTSKRFDPPLLFFFPKKNILH